MAAHRKSDQRRVYRSPGGPATFATPRVAYVSWNGGFWWAGSETVMDISEVPAHKRCVPRGTWSRSKTDVGLLLSPRYGIRRIFAHGTEIKVTSCGDGTFSVVIYRKGQPPEYHSNLTQEQVNERLAENGFRSAS